MYFWVKWDIQWENFYHEHIRLGIKYQKWSGVSQYDQKLCKAALEQCVLWKVLYK